MNRMSADELRRVNARHLWHPMAHPKAMEDSPPDIIVRGEGSWIWDLDGHRLVDGVGGTRQQARARKGERGAGGKEVAARGAVHFLPP